MEPAWLGAVCRLGDDLFPFVIKVVCEEESEDRGYKVIYCKVSPLAAHLLPLARTDGVAHTLAHLDDSIDEGVMGRLLRTFTHAGGNIVGL